MADFIVRKRRDFVFAIEDAPDKTFTLPDMSSLGFEDAKLLRQISGEEDIVEQGKLVKGTTGEDGFKIKLDVRLLAQGSVVTQYAQLLTIGNEPPEVVVRTVEKVLHH